jgi:hypothetical protein
VVDAFYFSVTTLTTVGLGDLSPQITVGKIFTVIYISRNRYTFAETSCHPEVARG